MKDISLLTGNPGRNARSRPSRVSAGWLQGLAAWLRSIRGQVGLRLKADRQLDQTVADAGCTPGFRAHAAMDHRRRVRN